MESRNCAWRDRRALVTGWTECLGSAVVRELLNRRASVIALGTGKNAEAMFAREREAGLFRSVQGRTDNVFRIHSALAIHEITAIFHLEEPHASSNSRVEEPETTAIVRAAELYHPRLPIVVARSAERLKLLGSQDFTSPKPIGIARFDELFGPGDRSESRGVGRTISSLLRGERFSHSKQQSRELIFVRDAARACLAVAEAIGSGSYPLDATFRTGWTTTEAEIARCASETIAGRTPAISFEREPENPLGWRPEYSFVEALAETVEWYRTTDRAKAESQRTSARLRKAA